MFARAKYVADKERNGEMTRQKEVEEEKTYLMRNMKVGKIEARSMMTLDNDRLKALEKMKRIAELKKLLPQIDCGICGAPSCDALAEDIVCHNAELTDCVFIQRNLEARGNMDHNESLKIMELIWGSEKIKNYVKNK